MANDMTDQRPYSLVIIDSTGEAMAAGGVNSNDDAEVARWFALAKQLTRLPGNPAVVVLDHVPKATDAPTLYSIGSQRKRAAITGASYRVDTIKEPAKGRDGKLKLVVAKDRLGNRPKGSVAAIADISSDDDGVRIHLHVDDAQAAADAGERFRPTVLMERVSRFVEDNPGCSKKAVRDGVVGKATGVDMAIDVLVDEGWLSTTAGARGAVACTVVRAFREGMEPTSSQVVPPRPTSSRDEVKPPETTSSLVPPSEGGRGRGRVGDEKTQDDHLVPDDLVPADDGVIELF